MPKKSRRQKGRSKKWSSANIANIVLGGIIAVSMILGSIFVFGGASYGSNAGAQTTAVPTVVAATATATSSVGQAPSPTIVVTTTPTVAPAATPTP